MARLFGRGGGADSAATRAAEAEQARSRAELAAGRLPLNAQRRLAGLGRDGGAFTSNLSVAEFALLQSIGAGAVAQLQGSCVYHVGWQQQPAAWGWTGGGASQELTVLTEAWNEARQRAFARLAQEAGLVGADAVVGVRLTRGHHDWAVGTVEFVVVGTGIRFADRALAPPDLVVTDLSGQDYWKLVESGYRPLGVVGASTVFYVVPGWSQRQAQSGMFASWANQELGDFTRGIYDARETALGRLTAEARASRAAGVVGVSIEHTVHEREVDSGGSRRTDLIVAMHVLGTTIAYGEGDIRLPPTSPVLDLAGGTRPAHLLGGSQ